MVGIRRSGQNSGAASDTGCRAVARFRILTRMLNVSTHGGWEAWIRFCLEGVVAQSVDAERRCDKLLALHKDFHNRLKVGSVRLSKLVDHLFSSPVISVNQYKRLFSVMEQPARHKDFHNRLKVGSVRLSKLVDHLFSSPVISVNQYKRLFSVTYPTARSDLKKLEAAGIVQQLEQMVEITYYCQPIYGITFEDISF